MGLVILLLYMLWALFFFRDVFWQGTCDDGCYALADLLGWGVSLLLYSNLLQSFTCADSEGGTWCPDPPEKSQFYSVS